MDAGFLTAPSDIQASAVLLKSPLVAYEPCADNVSTVMKADTTPAVTLAAVALIRTVSSVVTA